MNSVKKFYFYTGMVSLCAGALFFCCYQEWLVIYWNRPSRALYDTISESKKTVTLSFWKNNEWSQEQAVLMWSDTLTKSAHTLITYWLTTVKEEGYLDKQVGIETVLSSPSGQELYLSFTRNPFSKQWSAYQKHMFIEGLLKTVRYNNLSCSHVYFLVNHQPLVDYHLDFTIGWPLSGFLNQTNL